MSSTQRPLRMYPPLLALLLLLALALGLLSTSYAAGRALLLGVVMAWVGVAIGIAIMRMPKSRLVRAITARVQGLPLLVRIAIAISAILVGFMTLLVLLAVFATYLFPSLSGPAERGIFNESSRKPPWEVNSRIPVHEVRGVDDYEVVIEPINSRQSARFKVTQKVSIVLYFPEDKSKRTYAFLSKDTVSPTSAESGLLLKEVVYWPSDFYSMSPRQGNLDLYIDLNPDEISLDYPDVRDSSTGDMTGLDGPFCPPDGCPSPRIALQDFPQGSFLGAGNKKADPKVLSPYSGTEDVTWSIRDLEQPVVFSYIQGPFYQLPYAESILKRFEGVSSVSDFLIVLSGLILGLLVPLGGFVVGLIGGAIGDEVKDKLRQWFKRGDHI